MKIDPRAVPFATEELSLELLNLIKHGSSLQAVKRGANEALKQVNRGKAELVVIAADADPIEIVLHLPLACEDKGVPYVFIASKNALGRACNVSVPTIVASIGKHDALGNVVAEVIGKVEALI